MREWLPFLEGMTVHNDEVTLLPFVQVTPRKYADVHMLGRRNGLWVIFIDRTREAEKYQAMQQSANDAKLLHERLHKVSRELEEARERIASLEKAALGIE